MNVLGFSIRCFECNSHTDARCAEKVPPAELEKDCSEHKNGPKYTFCRKITQEIDFSVNNCKYLQFVIIFLIFISLSLQFLYKVPPDTRTIRSCGYEVGIYPNKCYQRSGFGGRHEVCACDENDLCNSAVNVKASFVVFAVILAFFAII